MDFRLDMSMMFAMHAPCAGSPRTFPLVHHQSEDDSLWPALRAPWPGSEGPGTPL